MVVPISAFLLLILAGGAHAVDLPEPDVGFGFYYSPGRLSYPLEEKYFADMKAHGCNTLTIQANDLPGQPLGDAPHNLARQLNTAARVGLTDLRFPVICYSADTRIVLDTLPLRDPAVTWPELVVQSIDEPNHTQERDLRAYRDAAHAGGIRIGTAVAGYVLTGYTQALPWCAPEDVGEHVPGVAEYLDIWVVLVGTLTDGVKALAAKRSAEVWSYLAYPSSDLLDRWTFGVYAWRAKPRVNLLWAYVDRQDGWDYSRVTETATGPVDRDGPPGYAEGIIDYRVLLGVRNLQTPRGDAFLQRVEAATPLSWWPRGYVRPPEEQAAQKPTFSLDAMRWEGLHILQRGGA
jgi:hypothetical protein